MVVLLALAIFVQVTSSSLSLPIGTGTTVLAILLPLLAAANVFYAPTLQRALSAQAHSPALRHLAPAALQIVQGVLVVVVATLAGEGLRPGRELDCRMERIQDAHACCGLNSVRDRAWPREGGHCPDLYPGRRGSCAAPWRETMRRSSGIEFAVALVVGVMQLVHLALLRLRNAGGPNARGYGRMDRRLGAHADDRLLEDGEAGDASTDGQDGDEGPDASRREYGTLENGSSSSRVQPSGLGEEGDHWQT
ncbi:hypothetical protein GGR56DRAFT_669056 [Xylariaceae sp. FL0804]|nr:hypothetical protein GGR56DRAFT_669056 [Xylariaceae sp. FL0804]